MQNTIKTVFFSFVTTLTSVSLIASPPAKQPSNSQQKNTEISKTIKEQKTEDKTDPKANEPISEEKELQLIIENSNSLPDEFESSEIEDQSHTAESVSDTLYDPNMDYGKGAPAPTPSPRSTKKRSITAFFASVILAAVGMLVTAHNEGRSPTPGSPKCPT